MEAIKTYNLTKKYKDITALDTLNLEIRGGELFSLLGVNGAGKTTLIKILSTITEATEGDATVGGFSIRDDAKKVKNLIGVSPQESAVAPNLTVFENLSFICGIFGFSKEKTEEKIKDALKLFKLDSVLKKKAGKLSGGYMRRLSIAMAIISEPDILFLDEPTLGLDVIARSELWELILSMKGKTTIVLTTHYMEEAEALSDRVGIMKNGRLLAACTPSELIKMTGEDKFESAFIKIIKEEKI